MSTLFKTIPIRMLAVFLHSALAVIGAGSIIGISAVKSALIAGVTGVAQVLQALTKGYIDDGVLDDNEINSAFSLIGEEK
jgi:hypothetical protein